MSHQDVAPCGIQPQVADGHPHRVGVGLHLLLGAVEAHLGRLEEGQQIHVHRAVGVLQGDGADLAGVYRGQVDAAVPHQPAAKGQPLGAVMVAADDEYLGVQPGQAYQELVKQLHGRGGRHGLVIDVPGQQHPIRALLLDPAQGLLQDMGLILQHGETVDPLAQVQVGQMDELHGRSSLPSPWPGGSKGHYTAPPGFSQEGRGSSLGPGQQTRTPARAPARTEVLAQRNPAGVGIPSQAQ